MKKTKVFTFPLVILLALCLLITACSPQPDTVAPSTLSPDEYGILEILLFDVGSADAILLTTENHALMIDTGERRYGQMIVDELRSREIDALDYMIITHFDKDHVGGAAEIIGSVDVRAVVVPNYRRDSKNYLRFAAAMTAAGIEPTVLEKWNPLEFTLDGVVFTTYPSELDFYAYNIGQDGEDAEDAEEARYHTGDSEDTDGPNANNFSLVTSVSHGNNHFLFTGDSKARRIREMLSMPEIVETDYDFLKVPHHGEHNRRSTLFIETISPSHAVITTSADAAPDRQTMDALNRAGAQVFITAGGNVHCVSDGHILILTQ